LLNDHLKGEEKVDWIFHTSDSFAFVILRFGLAVTFFMHGTQHAFGWHGGKGAKAQVINWRDKYHIPVPMGVFALVIELSTVLSMTLGFFVKPVAFCLAVFIAFALFLGHWSHGFFLASAPGKGSGIEYTLALFLMALAVTVGGAGALSIDGMLSR
jgi:putative oxidoreductase